MKNRSRKENLILNVAIGYITQIIILILQFIGRQIFIRFLSVDYLGVNGLYSNIFSVLSLAELGLGNVAVFSLYQPVAQKHTEKIIALVNFFRKAYYAIACTIFILGIVLTPFLQYLIKSELSNYDLFKYYILFLFGTISSYFAAHKVALLNANQDVRVQKVITLAVSLAQQIAQIAVLCILHSYLVYIVVQISASFMTAIIINIVVGKRYPYLGIKNSQAKVEKKEILKDVFSTALYKVGTVVINSTDNILISSLVSLTAVGLYSNYNMVIMAIQTFISIITNALVYGVGNLNTDKDSKKMSNIFNIMLFAYHFMACIGFIFLWNSLNDIITLWLGHEYLLNTNIVFIIALNFYLTNAISPIWMFREATGMFTKVKYLMICRAIINIVLSILLGKIYGTFGILFATVVSLLLTSFWYEPRLLFKYVFSKSSFAYWKSQIMYAVLTFIAVLISAKLIAGLNIDRINIGNLAIKIFICCIIPTFFFVGVKLKFLVNYIKTVK